MPDEDKNQGREEGGENALACVFRDAEQVFFHQIVINVMELERIIKSK